MGKEWVLNSTMNRFQLNFKRNVGATSESIRECSPASKEEWEKYYFDKVRSQEHITSLGEKLYQKITKKITPEISGITQEDCIKYMKEMVIDRTYTGYQREINVIYKELQKLLNVSIKSASDDWDRKYNVDYYIEINNKFIGLQIKPIPKGIQLAQIFKEHSIQKDSHQLFTKEYKSKVFYIFSGEKGDEKTIFNPEVVENIQEEIARLKNL